MPNFKSTSFKMTMLQGAGRICPPHVCIIQKTSCRIGLKGNYTVLQNYAHIASEPISCETKNH